MLPRWRQPKPEPRSPVRKLRFELHLSGGHLSSWPKPTYACPEEASFGASDSGVVPSAFPKSEFVLRQGLEEFRSDVNLALVQSDWAGAPLDRSDSHKLHCWGAFASARQDNLFAGKRALNKFGELSLCLVHRCFHRSAPLLAKEMLARNWQRSKSLRVHLPVR